MLTSIIPILKKKIDQSVSSQDLKIVKLSIIFL